MNPAAILFDLDDTIIRFGDRRRTGIAVAGEFADRLHPLTPEEIGNAVEARARAFWSDADNHKRWRFDMTGARITIIQQVFDSLREQAPGLTPYLAREFGDRFSEERNNELGLFQGAVDTLIEFRNRGVKLALVTNGDGVGQRGKIDRFDLASHFDHIQIEGEMGFGKPEERAYLHAMQALSAKPNETWMVGDNLEWEVVAPQRLGIYSIWHDHRGAGLPAGSTVKPDRIVKLISELL